MPSEGRRFPERPSVPVALHALVVVIATERLVMWQGRVAPQLWVLASVAALGTLWLRLSPKGRGRRVAWEGTVVCCTVAYLVALGVSWASLWAGGRLVEALEHSSMLRWSFLVVSDPTSTAYGYRCRARATAAGMPRGDVWLSLGEEPVRGDVLRGVGSYAVPSEDEYGRFSRMQGVWGSVKLRRVTRRGREGGLSSLPLAVRAIARRTIDPASSEERAVLAGCVLGDKTEMSHVGLDQLFERCGVAHLVAVSGSHISVVGALLAVLMGRLRLRPAVRMALHALLTGAFVLVCGAPASVVRAWAMTCAAFGSVLAGRRSDAVSAVSLAGLVMCLVEPGVVGQLGFLLSVSCVVGLCLFSGYAAYAVDAVVPRLPISRNVPSEVRIRLHTMRSDVVGSLAATLVAQLVTLPVVVPLFACVSLVAPLSSLLVSAPMAAALALGVVASLFSAYPLLAEPLLVVADAVVRLVLGVLRVLALFPFASVPLQVGPWISGLVVAGCALALLVWWPVPSRRMMRWCCATSLAVATCLVFTWRFLAPARICVLDIGQGDAILIQDGPSAILVDTGPGDAVVAALARNHVLHLDAIVLTHLHDDHYGGIPSLVGRVPCDRVIVADGVSGHLPDELRAAVEGLVGTALVEVGYKDLLYVGEFTLQVVWPRAPVEGTENPDSLELVVSYEHGRRALRGLLTGDAEQDETGAVIDADDVGDIDVLKVGHHGSEVSLATAQAEALDPELAVGSAGVGNEYGHPTEACVEVLEGAGSLFLCTKDVGDVEVRPGVGSVDVRVQKGP